MFSENIYINTNLKNKFDSSDIKADKVWSCCPKDWKAFSSHCYFISNDLANWNQSEEKCSSMGAHLMVVHSKEEQDFITKILSNRDAYFIGLLDPGHRQWRWVDQTPYNESATFWHRGEPNNDKEQCVIFNRLSGRTRGAFAEGGKSFLDMASEITYAEVKFKNESNSPGTDSNSAADKVWSCCPKDWKAFSSHCYFISNDLANWNQSEEKCSSMGAHLMVVHSKEEQDFITKILSNRDAYFIGLLDPGNRKWRWVDQTPYNESATRLLMDRGTVSLKTSSFGALIAHGMPGGRMRAWEGLPFHLLLLARPPQTPSMPILHLPVY
ncbi:hypothetical protein NN561_010833 [Cricetulus griseus]